MKSENACEIATLIDLYLDYSGTQPSKTLTLPNQDYFDDVTSSRLCVPSLIMEFMFSA